MLDDAELPGTKYREPWFLSNDNDSEEWCITDGVEAFPVSKATPVEFGLALAGTIERAARQQRALPVQDADLREKIEADCGYPMQPDDIYDGRSEEEAEADVRGYNRGVKTALDRVLAVLHPAQDEAEHG